MAKSMGVEGRVIFHGTVPLDNLVPILKSMDLGIIPNRRNVATELMLPVKMLECIALGIPVVAPRLKTISHYFTEEMVFFYEPEDADSMAKAIRSASSSEEDRLLRAREARRFLDRYGWDTHKSDFLAMYRNL
jgi:glycosyltransferase involved in cell wall biosynthesis